MNSTKESYYISKEIKSQLDKQKEIVTTADQDRVFIITGREGSGKSWLAMQLAGYLDSTIDVKDVCFDADSFANRIRTVKKHKAVIFDEAFSGLSSRGALSKENKKLVRLLQECRQRNLFLFIVLPSIFILDRYVALFRSHGLFNTSISKKNFKNRFYQVYNFKNKHLLYILGQRYMSYSKPRLWKKHRFYGKLPPSIDKEEYLKKKLDAFTQQKVEDTPEITRLISQRNLAILMCKEPVKYSHKDISDRFKTAGHDLTPSVIGRIVQNLQKAT